MTMLHFPPAEYIPDCKFIIFVSHNFREVLFNRVPEIRQFIYQ